MFKKLNKKRGFTLIELIIVIAIIAILAAIAVPAFGQIRQKANQSADLGNARSIFSIVATQITGDEIQLPPLDSDGSQIKYYLTSAVGESPEGHTAPAVTMNSADDLKVKQITNGQFIISLDTEGDIAVGISTAETADNVAKDNYTFIYGDETHIPTK